ncbi:DUF2273 domain-containing protein [Enterococcus hirae]|jgi:uncharacterized membrane protein|nr:DUF2273 domain-containing protein [Enterococcaceae bacterium]MDM8213679.1 DUF2273 domain-containing protein [Enterococcus hirae]
MKELFTQFKLPILFGIIGMILAILFVSVGFFKTLLVLLLMIAGVVIGLYLEKTGMLENFTKNEKNS